MRADGIMAKPMKTLLLHYPMLQFFSNKKYYIVLKELTNRFHVAVCLFRNRSQETSKCGQSIKVAHEA